ncbi:MAG: glycosyltransferase family 9 protein [Phycisphaeraceae bacterium]|nr:glycosyltransferase family 9 protein [Phycisphaeraceae bacterium]
MATPTLRALRQLWPQTHLAAIIKHELAPMLEGCPWLDEVLTIESRTDHHGHGHRPGVVKLSRQLASGQYDAAVLLTNSFRTALMTRLAGIPQRLGYDRDGRGFLLTDRLLPRREAGRFVPVSTRDYYMGLAVYLGAVDPDPAMQLFTRPQDDAYARVLLEQAGVALDRQPLVVLNPGANYGDAKMWYPDRFAQVADALHSRYGAAVAVSGSPRERDILDQVLAAARTSLIDLPRHWLISP